MAEHKGIGSPVSHPGIHVSTSTATDKDKGVKSPHVIEGHSDDTSHHDKETHGTSDDIDENTPIDKVKGPSVFHRVKEEIEAVVESVVHHKK